METEKCYRCGYCCKHLEIPYQHWVEAEDLGIPRKTTPENPCPHQNEISPGFYECNIHYTKKPRFCELDPRFKPQLSCEKLEEMIKEGKDVPKCLVVNWLGEDYLSKLRQKDLKH